MRCHWSTYFVSGLTPFDLLYLMYQRISEAFPGWTLTEIKNMPRFERDHWVDVILKSVT
jgi:hypothetical protein